MEKIKIHQGNNTKLEKVIQEIQGRCYANTVDIRLIFSKIGEAENKLLQLKIPKKSWTGISYKYEAGGKKSGWVNTATKIVLEYGSNSWYLVQIERGLSSTLIDRVELTDKAKLSIPTYIHLI
ncbi:MAG: hypothetical protein M1300_06240 [Epsilonproteobacteria bacterium]|nr:hypothetical protein [Campylobacterota bacterium]MCL5272498.1 hypothetical protein [Gammaproteobacteria bacterium]